MTVSHVQAGLESWHKILENNDPSGLDTLLEDHVTFWSPVVHTPQQGKDITKMYLMAAFLTLANDSFEYVNEFKSETGAVLEFRTEIDGIVINGIDMMTFNQDGQITEFKVMVRPLKAVNLLHQKMMHMLETMK
ncbi:hypothetical protein GCM10017044_00470 [Kordiimonas sediminis]|uniref:SnoaL-like domain-containing protein n=1 Tax=Kordiimonas sediminis TaxID=1735581 RepID=A0A919AJG9_9PROT|nr:nuclear transport factor 2 family protein [Kordiimonas sediminis]GHF10697.1 hypothetical protein GCM10017044_00470 [Kordiimonas sediminis]